MRRLAKLGVVAEGETKLDICLGLTVAQFLERRLQTRVFKAGYAKSIHHARTLIKGRHIRYVRVCLWLVLRGVIGAGGAISMRALGVGVERLPSVPLESSSGAPIRTRVLSTTRRVCASLLQHLRLSGCGGFNAACRSS